MSTSYKNKFIRKIYREKDIRTVEEKLLKLGSGRKIDAVGFMNIRLLTTIIIFILVLYNSNVGYILAPIVTVVYYYCFAYLFLDYPLKQRTLKLDKEALYFFEILTLTLESGRNLENALQVTCSNVKSEISREFENFRNFYTKYKCFVIE